MRTWRSKVVLAVICAALPGAYAARGAELAASRTSSTLISRQADAVATLSIGDLRVLLHKDFPSQPTLQSWITSHIAVRAP
jgi:hypothetical protein